MRSHLYSAAAAAAAAITLMTPCHAATDPRIKLALTLDTPSNGVSTTPDGRVFVLYARVDGSQAKGLPEVVEWINGTGVPYPDAQWNSYAPGSDASKTLVRVNSQRVGPDGSLWIVDPGSPTFGGSVILPGGPKVVVVDLKTDNVTRVYSFDNATRSDSLLDDIRFDWDAGRAYLTDAGAGGALIVLDLDTGRTVRVLEGHPSVGAVTPPSANGKYLGKAGAKQPAYTYSYADQLEVSPDGKYLHFQPASGGMSRIATAALGDALYNTTAAQLTVLGAHVEPFALTPSTGGTAIDADGSIYVSDTDRQAIEKVYANGTRTTLVRDDRLTWVDAMWIDTQGKLWLPAAQLDRGVPFSADGSSSIVPPLYVYTIDIGVGPPANDHA